MQPSDWISVIGTLINLTIAIFTAIAARAAVLSARASRDAVHLANQSADDSRKIAEEQTKALMTAAKANALASRINFYNEQIRPLQRIQEHMFDNPGRSQRLSEEAEAGLNQLIEERDHLAYWLDRQTDALGVGLNHECSLSPYNETIRARNKPGA